MNTKRVVSILIATGHTGGHFFPALSFARHLKLTYPQAEIHIVLGRMPTFAKGLARRDDVQNHVIEIPPFPKIFSFKMISFLLKYVLTYVQTFDYVYQLKPSLVVGFGSYASVPSILCAAVLRIPTLLHEQNQMAGRANRVLSYVADKVAISFPQTQGIAPRRKIIFTGYPLREEFSGAFRETSDARNSNPFKILVFGGSQGARRLNDVFLEVIGRLGAEEKKEFAVKHIVGIEDLNRIQEAYRQLDIQVEVQAFSYHIAEDYRSADLIISRSGAGTVFELIATGRPAILIPYPHASAHQKLNADFLAKRQAAILISEEHLSGDVLMNAILNLKRNPDQRTKLRTHLRELVQPNATQDLVKLAWELACRKN